MRAGPALALSTFGLCLAVPASAQSDGRQGPALTGMGRLAPVQRSPLASALPQIRFDDEFIIREDGTPGDRRSVVGSLPLVGTVAAEVGLFSVTGATPKEREFKRSDPVADVQPRRSRVAAVGLRMNF
jgi:hypothetical protein